MSLDFGARHTLCYAGECVARPCVRILVDWMCCLDRRSYREDDGSWYIKHLIEVISQYNMSDHLVDILTETQHRVTKRIGLISTGSQADQVHIHITNGVRDVVAVIMYY